MLKFCKNQKTKQLVVQVFHMFYITLIMIGVISAFYFAYINIGNDYIKQSKNRLNSIKNGFYERLIIHATNYKSIDIPFKWDTYVESGFPNTITYDQRNLFVGYDTAFNKHITYTYLMPDYSVLKQAGIDPSLIESVQANIWIYHYVDPNVKLRIYIPKTSWDQYHLTYNNQPELQYYNYKNIVLNNPQGVSFGITSAFIRDYERYLNANEPLGFVVKLSNTTTPAIRIWSNECLLAPSGLKCESQEQRPYIHVVYKDNTIPQISENGVVAPVQDWITNNKEIVFRFKQAQDADNDKLYYRIVIAKDDAFTSIYKTSQWYEWQQIVDSNVADSDTINTDIASITISVSDNTYYWRLEVKDEYNNKAVSESRKLVVDTTPPSVPQIQDEPPYTKGDTNTIYLSIDNYEPNSSFEIQASMDANFAKDVLSSGWITQLSYTFEELKPGKYYYRARSKDFLGNISNWSSKVWSIQDQSKPNIVYFKVSPDLIGISQEYINIKARFYDVTLSTIGYLVYKNNNLKLQKSFKDQEFFNEKVDIKSWSSGKYYVYAYAYDKFNNKIISEPKEFVIDKQIPNLEITGFPKLINGLYTKYQRIKANIKCTDSLSVTKLAIYVNNKKIYEGKPLSSYYFNLQNKRYNIKFKCEDAAGNKAEKNYVLIVDNKKPEKPNLSVKLEKDLSAIITAKCSESGNMIFWFGSQKYVKTCKNGYAKLIIKPIKYDTSYTVNAFEKDFAGNISDTSSINFKYPRPKEKTDKPINISCYIEYNKQTHKFDINSCKIEENINIKVVGDYYKDGYRYQFVYNLPHNANIYFRSIACKKHTLFDLRTYFSCIPEGTTMFTEKATVLYGLEVVGGQKAKISDTKKYKASYWFKKPQKELKVKIRGNFYASFHVGPNEDYSKFTFSWARFYINWTKPIVLTKTMKAPIVHKPINYSKPFSWMFNSYKYYITQWYGHTCWNTFHRGIDIGVYKKPILAVADGVVVSMGKHYYSKQWSGGYWICIKHDNGLYSYYWHLDGLSYAYKHNIRVGTRVKRGQVVGISGNSGYWGGYSLPYHLHFEIRKSRNYKDTVDPTLYLNVDWNKMNVCRSACCSSGQDPRKRM